MFKDIRLIIYDLDGVLIDCNEAILEAFSRTMDEIGEPFNPDALLSRIGYSLHQIFRDLLPPEHHSRVEEYRHIYIKHFQSLDTGHIKLLPEVAETLAELKKRGYMQSVATNKTDTEAIRILEGLGVSEYFDLYAGYMTVKNPKPAPDMILYTLKELKVAPRQAVFVDDTDVGLTAGIKAGVNTVGITTGNNSLKQIQAVNPTTIIHRFSQLTEIIQP